MPSQQDNAIGEQIRQRGKEFGTTTGRPRRCGWFDGVAARYANRINRFDAACVTLIDVLDDFDEIRVCVGYRLDGKELGGFPACLADAERIEAVYESLDGWKSDTTAVRRWQDLPRAALRYLERIGELIGTEVAMVGVGPDREQSILKPGSWPVRQLGL